MTLGMLFWTVLVPLGVATGVCALFGVLFWGRAGGVPRAVPAVAMACTLLVGLRALMGQPEWTPALAEGWLFHLAVLAGIAGVTLSRSGGVVSVLLPLVGLGCFVLVVQLGRAATNGDMGVGAIRVLWPVCVVGSIVIPGFVLARADRVSGARGLVLAMGISAGAAAGAIVLCNGIKLAQIEGLLGLGLLPIAVMSWRGKGPSLAGAAVVFSAVHGAVWWLTYFYQGDMPIWALLFNISGPITAALIPIVFAKLRERPARLAFVQTGAAACLAAASVACVWASRAQGDAGETKPYAGY